MKTFIHWLEEKSNSKKTKESLPTTVVSSPLRGQNQSQGGFTPNHAVADYTISDEYVQEVIAGVGHVRMKPVYMQTVATPKSRNAPGSAGALQRAADERRQQLDAFAQKEKLVSKKTKEKLIKQRKANADHL